MNGVLTNESPNYPGMPGSPMLGKTTSMAPPAPPVPAMNLILLRDRHQEETLSRLLAIASRVRGVGMALAEVTGTNLAPNNINDGSEPNADTLTGQFHMFHYIMSHIEERLSYIESML